MRITSVEPIVVRVGEDNSNALLRGGWVFVRVHTDEGISGLGEASHGGDDRLVLAVVEAMAAHIVGRSPFDIRALWLQMAGVKAGRAAATALSAIEQALWDIRGRTLGVPIHALFGGPLRRTIRLYANINRSLRDRSREAFARHARQAVDEGFSAVKIAPFDELREPSRVRTGGKAAWRAGLARAAAVRDAVGPDVELAIDCHGRMEASEAIAVGRALAELDILWYEEPVPDAQCEDMVRVAAAVSLPTAAGENLFAMEGFRPLLTERVVDVLMPDVKHCGGLAECRAIAEAARLRGLLVAPHNPSGPVASAATAQVACGMVNFLILEHAWSEVPWRAELLDPPERIVDGHLVLPDGPGLGHVLNERTVAEHRAG